MGYRKAIYDPSAHERKTTRGRGPAPGGRSSWKDEMLVDIYRLARGTNSDDAVAKGIGVRASTLKHWVKKRPAVRYALEEARRPAREGDWRLSEYVYERLPEELKPVWDQIHEWEKIGDGSVSKVEALLANKGKQVRISLFFHALVFHNFNASAACRTVNITQSTLSAWKENEPGFAELLDQFIEHKKNFFEEALVDLVRKRNTAAVLFANKTMNADRGYGDVKKVTHVHSGGVAHAHLHVQDIESLDLPPDVMRQVLDAIRRKKRELTEQRAYEEGLPAPTPGRVRLLPDANQAKTG
jgi:hypothetical protein